MNLAEIIGGGTILILVSIAIFMIADIVSDLRISAYFKSLPSKRRARKIEKDNRKIDYERQRMADIERQDEEIRRIVSGTAIRNTAYSTTYSQGDEVVLFDGTVVTIRNCLNSRWQYLVSDGYGRTSLVNIEEIDNYATMRRQRANEPGRMRALNLDNPMPGTVINPCAEQPLPTQPPYGEWRVTSPEPQSELLKGLLSVLED